MKSAESWARFLPAGILLAGASIFLQAHSGAERLPARQEFASLPLEIGEWVGVDLPIPPNIREALGAGDFLERVYRRSPAEPRIDLFLAYFPTQRTGTTIHSPQNCLPGAGWAPIEHSHVQLAVPGGGNIIVNRYVLAKGLDRDLILYWYEAHGRVVASEYWAKFYLVADSIRLNRSDGALVRIITPLSQEESSGEAERSRLVPFAGRLNLFLERYIPK